MKKIVAIFAGLCFLASVSVSFALELKDPDQQLRSQIIIYNLISGLSLEEPQVRLILEEAKKLKTLKQEIEEKIEESSSRQKNDLLALKEEVKKEVPEVSKHLERDIHKGNLTISKLRREYFDSLAKSTKLVKAVLTDKQRHVVENFKPCLVPHKGKGRVGQAQGSEVLVKFLEKVKAIPEYQYQRQKDAIVGRLIEKISLKLPKLKEEKLNEVEDKIVEVIEETRRLSDVEFFAAKYQKADEIKDMLGKRKLDLDRRIAFFLLNPETIPLLEEQLFRR